MPEEMNSCRCGKRNFTKADILVTRSNGIGFVLAEAYSLVCLYCGSRLVMTNSSGKTLMYTAPSQELTQLLEDLAKAQWDAALQTPVALEAKL